MLELNREKAPVTVENFMKYVEEERYDGTIFHRVIATFMIQGGGFTEEMEMVETDDPIKNEWRNGLSNVRGTIAMARRGQQPDSATNQFFINVQDNPALDQPRDGAGYAVFGKVIAGMDTVDAIRAVPTGVAYAKTPDGERPMRDVPAETVIIETARAMSAEDAKALEGKPLKKDKEKDEDEAGQR